MKTKVLTFLLLLFAYTISAQEFQVGDLHYRAYGSTSDPKAEVIKSEDYQKLTSVVIPDSVFYDGHTYPVTKIGANAFSDCYMLENVSLGNNITYIERYAFSGCSSIKKIVIGENVTSIKSLAFKQCYFLVGNFINNSSLDAEANNYWGAVLAEQEVNGLMITGTTILGCRTTVTSVTIPHYITEIEAEVFYPCKLLTSIIWNAKKCSSLHYGGGINGLGTPQPTYDPFEQWSKAGTSSIRSQITSVVFGDSVEYIPAYMCSNMVNLTSVEIPQNIISIGNGAFVNCSGLTNISIPNNVTTIGNDAFAFCFNLSSIKMPNLVTSIGECAFAHCDALTAITLPESLVSMGEDAFEECLFARENFVNKSSLDAEANGYWGATIGDTETNGLLMNNDTIFDCRRFLRNVNIPENAKVIGENAFYDCDSIRNIVIPSNITNIEKNAFGNCDSLISVTLSEGLKTIGEKAFYICEELVAINIPEGLNIIGDYAFYYCQKLDSIYIPESLESIGNLAFHSCSKLESVTIPGNVKSIGEGAFADCEYLLSITIHDGVKSIGDRAFTNTGYYHTSDWTDGVLYINNYLIHANKSDLPINYKVKDNTYAIASYAFSGCKNLTSISLPESLTAIGEDAFYNCSNLVSADIPANVEYLGSGAFHSCSNLTTVNFAEQSSLKNIEDYTFKYCSNLNSVKLPNGLENIRRESFQRCSSLAYIELPNSVVSIYPYAFDHCSSLTKAKLSEDLMWIGAYAFDYCYKLDSIVIPDKVTSLGYHAFAYCSGLKEITIGQSLNSFYENTHNQPFYECRNITSVIWKPKTFADEIYIIYGSTSNVTSFVFGDSVEHIPSGLCEYQKKLTAITIPTSIKSIGNRAFYGCSSLTETHYAGTKEDWCKIKFGNQWSNPNYYAKNLRIGNQEVTEVEFPADIDTIYPGVFYGCNNLSMVKIPNTVKSIGAEAFGECRKLYDVYCYAIEPPAAETNTFANYNAYLHVPTESIRNYEMDMVFGSFKNIKALNPDETKITDIETDKTINNVYDMQGRRVNSVKPLSSGFYIINGEKTIIK